MANKVIVIHSSNQRGGNEMKLYLPAHIQQRLNELPEGTALLGTHSADHDVATITHIRLPDESSKCDIRRILAVIGEQRSQHTGHTQD